MRARKIARIAPRAIALARIGARSCALVETVSWAGSSTLSVTPCVTGLLTRLSAAAFATAITALRLLLDAVT